MICKLWGGFKKKPGKLGQSATHNKKGKKNRGRSVSREDNVAVMGDNVAVMGENVAVMKPRRYRKSQDGNVSRSQLESQLFCNMACDWSELASQLY